jgi:hypothetical protein
MSAQSVPRAGDGAKRLLRAKLVIHRFLKSLHPRPAFVGRLCAG